MAAIPSSFIRLQSPANRIQPGLLVTPVTQRRQIIPSRQPAPRLLTTMPNEPEDARLTGGTRSLDRRLLALNLSGTLKRPVAKTGPESSNSSGQAAVA